LAILAEFGDRLLTLELYGLAVIAWTLIAAVILIKMWQWGKEWLVKMPVIILIVFLWLVMASAVNAKRGSHPWWFPIRASISVRVESEIVADVHTRAKWLAAKNGGRTTEVHKALFQDLYHEWKITLTPNRDTPKIVVSVRDARKPTDSIRTSTNAVISEAKPGWTSGFDEPTQVPDFYVRTITLDSFTESQTITIRKPIKSRVGVNQVTAIDLDLDRQITAACERCTIDVIPICTKCQPLFNNPHFIDLSQEINALLVQHVSGGSVTTRLDPDVPYPPLAVDESEIVEELHCVIPACTQLTVTMNQKTRVQ
jgi:hypothetical protein